MIKTQLHHAKCDHPDCDWRVTTGGYEDRAINVARHRLSTGHNVTMWTEETPADPGGTETGASERAGS